jgi:hypothetical protein
MNFEVYSLGKYRERQKIILCMNICFSNHLTSEEKVRFIFAPLFLYIGSGIQNPGSRMTRKAGSGIQIRNPDPGSGINIPDPQHWFQHTN